MRQTRRVAYSWEVLAIVIIGLFGAASLVGAHFLLEW
jgi:hypothetical protein